MNFLQQVFVGEPDEVEEVDGDELVGVGDLKGQLRSGRGVRERVRDIVERSALAKVTGGLAEIIIVGDGSDHEPASGSDLLRREALTARGRDGDQLSIGERDGGFGLRVRESRGRQIGEKSHKEVADSLG